MSKEEKEIVKDVKCLTSKKLGRAVCVLVVDTVRQPRGKLSVSVLAYANSGTPDVVKGYVTKCQEYLSKETNYVFGSLLGKSLPKQDK